MPKVTIVGAGNVGATAAHIIASKNLADVVLIDVAEGLPQGVCIKSVQAGSDAWRQGLRAGDVIVEANGVSIRTMDELQALKNGMQVGEVLSLRYCRENGWHTADVTLVDQYTLED